MVYEGVHKSVKFGAYDDIAGDVSIGENSIVWAWCRIGSAKIGKSVIIHNWVNIGNGCIIGDECNIQEHGYLSDNVVLGKNVFVGVGVSFGDEKYPGGKVKARKPVVVGDNVVIGNNSTIMGGVRIGDNSVVGAGSVVTKNIPPNQVWWGVPAQHFQSREKYDEMQSKELGSQ